MLIVFSLVFFVLCYFNSLLAQAICVTPPCRVIKRPDQASLVHQVSPTSPLQTAYFQMKAKYSELAERYNNLQSRCDKLFAENSEMKKKLAKLEEAEEKLAKLHEYFDDLSQNAMSLENAYHDTLFQLTRIKDKLAETWSENQIRLYIGEIKKVKVFDYRALARAAFMRIIGNKKLTFIRDVAQLPIPCETTIQNFIRKLQLGPGLLIFALDLLFIKLQHAKSLAEKFLIFYIDATPLNGKYRFNEETGQIESENAAYEIKVASLLGTFSQTIFYDFYMPSAEQLLELFSEICKIGGIPVLFSSDSHSQNLKMYKYLITRSYQQEKFTNEKEMLSSVPDYFFISNDKKPDFLETQADMDGRDELVNVVEEDLKNNMRIYLNLDQCHNLRVYLEHLRKGQVYTVEGVDLSIKPLKIIVQSPPPGCHLTLDDLGTNKLQNMKSALRVVSLKTIELLDNFEFSDPNMKEQAMKLAELFR